MRGAVLSPARKNDPGHPVPRSSKGTVSGSSPLFRKEPGHPGPERHSLCCFRVRDRLPPREKHQGREPWNSLPSPIPSFRQWLIDEGKRLNLIYKDQKFVPGKKGEYPAELEIYRTTKTGFEIFMRPIKISDEPLLKDLFYSLSDKSLYRQVYVPSQRRAAPAAPGVCGPSTTRRRWSSWPP